MIKINSNLSIPVRELEFAYSTSSGPGGQHVNKVATRVTLLFDVHNSPSLSDGQKERIAICLATRINKVGILRVVTSKHRSQRANRRSAIERFASLLAETLQVQKRRKKSNVPAAAKRRRLEQKRKRSVLKQLRGRVKLGDDRG